MFIQHIISDRDLSRLRPLLDHSTTPTSEALDAELHGATIVASRDVPANVVTMNSDVVYEDCSTGARRAIRLVYPNDADANRGWISVLAPIGCALLGLAVGQEVEWQLPTRRKRVRVVDVRQASEE